MGAFFSYFEDFTVFFIIETRIVLMMNFGKVFLVWSSKITLEFFFIIRTFISQARVLQTDYISYRNYIQK